MAFPRFSLHRVAVSLLGSSMVLAVWLVFGLRFDLQSSPAWHFVPYLLMLASTITACSVMWTFPAFSWLGQVAVPVAITGIPSARGFSGMGLDSFRAVHQHPR